MQDLTKATMRDSAAMKLVSKNLPPLLCGAHRRSSDLLLDDDIPSCKLSFRASSIFPVSIHGLDEIYRACSG